MDITAFLLATVYVFYTPYTKVEESFNLQAMHDILYLRGNFSQYDHHEFPGVVPRTFLGPLTISILSAPFIIAFEALRINKFWAQYVVRLILVAVISIAWNNLRNTITKLFDLEIRMWFIYITFTQFHFMFYMSRPLPNILALPLVLFAISHWLKGETKPFIIYAGIATIIFRFEVAIFLGLLLLYDFFVKKVTVASVFKVALPTGLIILTATIAIDSFFWQRLVWPEGEVLWYNTILNKSSDWGTSPFLWYFYSALPRAMGTSLLFVPLGLYYERRIRPIVFAALGFVFIYSFLPHKELRFIIYVFPVLNLAAACACYRFWINSTKSVWHGFLAMCAGGHLLLNILVTLFLLVVSATNYPGGVALTHLHQLEANATGISVHISNLAAQSGVSRFLQMRSDWSYCKNETVNYTREDTQRYTHLLIEAKIKYNAELWSRLQEEFAILEYVDCFNSIGIQYNSLLPVRIKTKPCIGILRRKPKPKLAKNDKQKRKDKKKSKTKTKTEIPDIAIESNDAFIYEQLEEKLQEQEQIIENLENWEYVENLSNLDLLNENKISNEKTESAFVVEPLIEPVEIGKDSQSNIPVVDKEFSNVDTNDIIVDSVNGSEDDNLLKSDSFDDIDVQMKEINFSELRNLATDTANKKTKATKLKIRKLIENHYRSKGRQIENDSFEKEYSGKQNKRASSSGMRQSVKAIIKQERIKEMIEQIATMDLTRMCDLEHMSTKDCLKNVIDTIDNEHIESKVNH